MTTPDGRREKLLVRAAARMLAKARAPIRIGIKIPAPPHVRALLVPGRVIATLTEDTFGKWTYRAVPPCEAGKRTAKA